MLLVNCFWLFLKILGVFFYSSTVRKYFSGEFWATHKAFTESNRLLQVWPSEFGTLGWFNAVGENFEILIEISFLPVPLISLCSPYSVINSLPEEHLDCYSRNVKIKKTVKIPIEIFKYIHFKFIAQTSKTFWFVRVGIWISIANLWKNQVIMGWIMPHSPNSYVEVLNTSIWGCGLIWK